MKFTLSTFILICATFYASATVLIVDNNGNKPAGGHIYATFALGQTASSAGDTILIIPSTNSYGTITISKSLVVIGGGFNPDIVSGVRSTFDVVIIGNGVSNVTISGIISGYIQIGSGATAMSMNNILVEKCNIGYITNNSYSNHTLSNFVFKQNLLNIPSGQIGVTLRANTQSNIIFSNNIFSFNTNGANGPYITTGGVTFDHNVFVGAAGGQQFAFYQLVNCTVSNNIFYGKGLNGFGATSSGVSFINNLVFGATDNSIISTAGFTLTNNLASANPQFVNMSSPAPFDFTKDLSLQGGSPAKSAGSDGTDLGIYGGSSPYKNSGVSLPVVKSLTMPTTIKQGTNTSATISVNGN